MGIWFREEEAKEKVITNVTAWTTVGRRFLDGVI